MVKNDIHFVGSLTRSTTLVPKASQHAVATAARPTLEALTIHPR